MSDCSKHKREVAVISDMEELAEMIGDLHYESLAELLTLLSGKLKQDARKDLEGGRQRLAFTLDGASGYMLMVAQQIDFAWHISKPFMNNKNTG